MIMFLYATNHTSRTGLNVFNYGDDDHEYSSFVWKEINNHKMINPIELIY